MDADRRLQILDCTIRDGGYVNDWQFDAALVRETYRALSKSGVDYVELGFRAGGKQLHAGRHGPWRNVSEEFLRQTTSGIRGAQVAVMANYGEIDADDLSRADESIASLIRIAAHKTDVFHALDLLDRIKASGYATSLQAMAITNYAPNERLDLLRALRDHAIDYLYLADTFGAMLPSDVPAVFEPFLSMNGPRIGFHPHNNLQMAFANTLEAIRFGVNIVDVTLYGMGRGAGNLPTEVLLGYLSTQGDPRFNVIPLLACIDRYYVDLQRRHPWGYCLPYMISGMFRCHPYYAAELVRRREYSIEDIWAALGFVNQAAPVGFDRDLIDRLIRRGIVSASVNMQRTTRAAESTNSFSGEPQARSGSAIPIGKEYAAKVSPAACDAPPEYANRHTGRDFLVLANGPSLKQHRRQIESFIARHDPICLGANFLGGLFVPDYHAFCNQNRFVMHHGSVSPRSRLLIGENLPSALIREYIDTPFETLCFDDILDAEFDIVDGRITTNCRTISVLLAGVSIVMGADRVFIAGMDGYLDPGAIQRTLFYDEPIEPTDVDVNLDRHRWNERFLAQIDAWLRDHGREGIHIITPTTHQRFYKGIETFHFIPSFVGGLQP